jgi:hypothetical protein
MSKTRLAILPILLLSVLLFVKLTYANGEYPQTYKTPSFWDEGRKYCFASQESNVSCVEASIQMVLESYNVTPLPTQEDIATEMQTDPNHTTEWDFTYIPFDRRNFTEYINQSLSQDADQALAYLKGNVSMSFPVIVDTWYDQAHKDSRNMTHARVVTGYNETGIFYHDPIDGPNRYMGNVKFAELWSTDEGFWAFIVENATASAGNQPVQPSGKDLGKYLIDNLDVIALLIVGMASERHFVGRLTVFSNSLALDLFFTKNHFTPWYVMLYLVVGTILGVIGLLYYLAKEELSADYYLFTFVFYSSITVAIIMLISAFVL